VQRRTGTRQVSRTAWEGRPQRVRAPYAKRDVDVARHPSRAGHEESRLNLGGPPPKAKYNQATDSEQYREGTVKRTAGAE
jgi:hypothetical protein